MSPVEATRVMRAAGSTNPGLQREVNEDRFYADAARGLFMVIDGVGGQAAGGKAADTAAGMLKTRLERATAPALGERSESKGIASRLREAIAIANNEIHRLARLRTEWNGMACVLTAVLVHNGSATVGHVGDTRLYKLRRGRIEKITRDHSPVGEREDAREISEQDAMQHPRRNEVYRDVGSELHDPADPDFIDVQEISFEPDAALLLCSDGLTDLVHSSSINQIVRRHAGRPADVVNALIDAANAAGGKDNVTVVYVEGDEYPPAREEPAAETEITRRLATAGARGERRRRIVRVSNIILMATVILLAFTNPAPLAPAPAAPDGPVAAAADAGRIVVRPTQSIGQALQRAQPGTTIAIEPGEYRETLVLKSHVRLVSTMPHAAIIRLPGTASEQAAAIVARGVADASLDGLRIVGDAATPLGIGVLAIQSELSMTHVEVTGAAGTAIDIGRDSRVRVVGGDIRDNPGSAVVVRAGGEALISHSTFAGNATGGGNRKPLVVDAQGSAQFVANVFVGSTPAIYSGPSQARAAFVRRNWFVEPRGTGRGGPNR
jgi:serine/threonine protein phosphatase PrpC